MADRVVYTGFDPEFGDRLNRLIALAKARGYAPELISGRRDAYGWPGMKGQSQAELYGQLGKPGGPRAAAPPGYSPHQYGVAGDVAGVPQSVLEQLASEVGLRAIHGDPNHLELANWRQEVKTQPPMTAWDQSNPANVPSQMAMNMEANAPSQPGRPVSATPIPGGGSHADFIRSYAKSIGLDPNLALGIANAEGLRAWTPKNPNAASGIDVENGQPFSFGDFQLNIHPGAMGSKALAAGIDPRDPNQWQAADKFAIDQMKAGGVGPWKGDPVAKAYLASGAVPALPAMPNTGTTITSTPAQPQTPASWLQRFVTKPEPTVDENGKPVQGKSPLEKLAGAIPGGKKEGEQAAAPEPVQLGPVQDPMAAMAGPAGQLFAQAQAAAAKPLTWSSKPYGWDAGQQMVPGMTLNSMGQSYG